jgi:hypothetical protein
MLFQVCAGNFQKGTLGLGNLAFVIEIGLSSDDFFASEICSASSGDGTSGLSLSNIIFSKSNN